MSDEMALLTAIRNNPKEDTPRLVYADWLQERAATEAERARAEFIRVQVEKTGLYSQRDQFLDRFQYLEGREKKLRTRFAKKWLAPFAGAEVAEARFSRGFLSSIEFSADECDADARPPWHREPFAPVKLSGTAKTIRRLCAQWLNGVSDLSVYPSSNRGADPIAELVSGAPCAETLRSLSLWHEGFSDRALRAVAAGGFRNLSELSCYGQFTPGGWDTVLNSSTGAALRDLTIGHRAPWETADRNRPGPDLARVLADAPLCAGLKFLWLGKVGLGDSGLNHLARGTFAELNRLHIDNDRFGTAALRALGEGEFRALTEVRFSQIELDDTALSVLADAPLMSQLERLDLSMNSVTAAGVAALASCGRIGKLEYLDLGFNEIGDEGAAALARSPHFTGLKELYLSGAHLTDAGADAIRNAPWAGRLKTLFLSYNDISKRKAAELTRHFGSVLWIGADKG